MVSVRKSHQMSETNFEQWLSSLELNEQKHQALEKLWQQVNQYFDGQQECQTKTL